MQSTVPTVPTSLNQSDRAHRMPGQRQGCVDFISHHIEGTGVNAAQSAQTDARAERSRLNSGMLWAGF